MTSVISGKLFLNLRPPIRLSHLTLRGFSKFRHRSVYVKSLSKMSHVYGDIVKSPADTRNYRGLKLTNELKVLLINDSTTDTAAAAMCVAVGSMSDPPNLPGLAHFCEHMLFMGSKKYPTENDYDKFISDNGGGTNAYTYPDHTVYYFDTAPDALKPSLDRFAQFFIAPLFNKSAVKREVNAVHSEHEEGIPDDETRIDYAVQLCSLPGHPYASFTTGNRDTLWNIPKKQGIDVRAALLEFYEKYYSSNAMTLAVLGKDSLDELQSLVEEIFISVPNRNVSVPFWPDNPYGPGNLPRLLEVTPIKDQRSVNLHFPIPYTAPFYKTQPDEYLAHLIGHEGTGSLLLLLKDRKLASSLTCSPYELGRGFAVFVVSIELTQEGFQQWETVVQYFFEYVKMMREEGPQKWIWNELKVTSETTFRFLNKKQPDSMVSGVCSRMVEYNMEEILSHCYLQTEYEPKLIQQFMDCLSPSNILVNLVSRELKDRTPLVDEYYGVHHNISNLDGSLIEKLEACQRNGDFRLPLANDFIPTNFAIKPRTEAKDCITPKIVVDTELSRVWFLQDMEFLLPKGVIYLEIFSPLPAQSVLKFALNSLFKKMLEDSLQHDLYPATIVGASYTFDNTLYGISVYVNGYDHKLPVVMQRIIHAVLNFTVDSKRFDIAKDCYIRGLRDWKDNEPYKLLHGYLKHTLSEKGFMPSEILQIVEDLTVDNLEQYASDFLAELKLQYLFYGNWILKDALDAAESFEQVFKKKGTKPAATERVKEIEIPPGMSLQLKRETDTHRSSAGSVLVQFGLSDTRSDVICDLLVQIFEEPFFDQLRTKECLGYTVNVNTRRSRGTNGLLYVVQGGKHPAFVETRIENFMNTMNDFLEKLTNEEFEQYKRALATVLAQKPQNISERANNIWSEIVHGYYKFTYAQMKIQELQDVTIKEVKTTYNNLISKQSRRRLDIHVVSFAEGGAGKKPVQVDESLVDVNQTKEDLVDVHAWKSRQSYYCPPQITVELSN